EHTNSNEGVMHDLIKNRKTLFFRLFYLELKMLLRKKHEINVIPFVHCALLHHDGQYLVNHNNMIRKCVLEVLTKAFKGTGG
ncbi:MAG: hypothetical protein OEX19_16885, partial [Gammaproteobacteria bacterium]|nr:hypothetical protein [Gammaproteobacteria bacterium]